MTQTYIKIKILFFCYEIQANFTVKLILVPPYLVRYAHNYTSKEFINVGDTTTHFEKTDIEDNSDKTAKLNLEKMKHFESLTKTVSINSKEEPCINSNNVTEFNEIIPIENALISSNNNYIDFHSELDHRKNGNIYINQIIHPRVKILNDSPVSLIELCSIYNDNVKTNKLKLNDSSTYNIVNDQIENHEISSKLSQMSYKEETFFGEKSFKIANKNVYNFFRSLKRNQKSK